MNSREAAFLALLYSLKGERFISVSLDEWMLKSHPLPQDYHLAQQIAYGSAQMALALDYLILQVSKNKKVNLKLKEKALLRTALYQLYYLDRIPSYAIVNETMQVAKKYFKSHFLGYLNAVLRKLSNERPELPQGKDMLSLSIRYSYPLSFVEELSSNYGLDSSIAILEAGNKPARVTARVRHHLQTPDHWKIIVDKPVKMVVIDADEVLTVARSKEYYIQNVTPAYLTSSLCMQLDKKPKRILDLCAAPGGKSLVMHDLFPDADLYANDISLIKTQKLKENFLKYDVQALISCAEGQFLAFDEKFDVIVIDVPCSNTGVLNKRPEARWRLCEDYYNQLGKIQFALLENAKNLLKFGGEIWYMTCSILPRENEDFVSQICQKLDLQVKWSKRLLPQGEWDGGFAACLVVVA